MADTDSAIPTLTDISHPGNQDMLNHFDGHQFDDETPDTEFSLENASDIENTPAIENTELDEIPSITLEDDSSENVVTEDFSDAMQSIVNNTSESNVDKQELKEKINQAISDALPGIEAQLKGKLYSKFGI